MKQLPTQSLRTNLGTWAIPAHHLPAIGSRMANLLPPEPFDPAFVGQALDTTYFDTPTFALRNARQKKDRYLTLRIRCYGANHTYGLSVKTEEQKCRKQLEPDLAEALLADTAINPTDFAELLPFDLYSRLLDLTDGGMLAPIVKVCAHRFAVEDKVDRLTLDTEIEAHSGKRYHASVLEWKSTDTANPNTELIPSLFTAMHPPMPIKLSKFLWATH